MNRVPLSTPVVVFRNNADMGELNMLPALSNEFNPALDCEQGKPTISKASSMKKVNDTDSIEFTVATLPDSYNDLSVLEVEKVDECTGIQTRSVPVQERNEMVEVSDSSANTDSPALSSQNVAPSQDGVDSNNGHKVDDVVECDDDHDDDQGLSQGTSQLHDVDSTAMGCIDVEECKMQLPEIDEEAPVTSNALSEPADETQVPNPANDSNETERESLVTFSTVEIREYPSCIGDNPGARRGVALSIAWNHVDEARFDIEDYESNRPARRQMNQLLIPSHIRETRLREMGYSREEIRIRLKAVNIARAQRQHTVSSIHLAQLEETLQYMFRATRNATFGRGRKIREREYLRKCLSLVSTNEKAHDIIKADDTHHTLPEETLHSVR